MSQFPQSSQWYPRALVVVVLALLAWCAPRAAQAHHSFAMYDSTKLVVVDGTVTNFQWTNPHVLLWVTGAVTNAGPDGGTKSDGGGAGDAPTLWAIELPTSPGNLGRMGWSKHSLKGGDHIIVELNPLRDGRHGGSFKKATLVDSGKVLLANPVSKSADGGANYGPDEAKKDAGSDAATPKRGWGCSIRAQAQGSAWPLWAFALSVVFFVRRRRAVCL